jgi:hypothetical protein
VRNKGLSVADQAAKTRAEAIEGFARLLRDLRESVGNPAFREMSGRSRAISHTTLHEAAQGNRLPSWATTVEFVKACGAEPAEYRERWEQANRVVRSVISLHLTRSASDSVSRLSSGNGILSARVTDHGGTDPEPVQAHASSDPPPDTVANDEAPNAPAPRNRRRLWFVLLGVAAVGAVAVAVVVALDSGKDSPAKKGNGTSQPLKAPLSAADCPMHSPNPPAAPPAHAGDASAFIADITLPDCSHVHRGQLVSKVWRLKNVGTVPWTGYSLHRLDVPQQSNQCQTISDIPIDDTAPGDLVDIRTEITAPKTPGFCFVRFKMVDASGQVAFPGSRPVNFQLIVD